jgi:hypothetical protein
VSVAVLPIQIAVGFATAVIVGTGVTLRVDVTVFVHPAALDPERVYVVVMVGETTTGEPDNPPGFHE